MKAVKVEGGAGKAKAATEAVDEDKLYDFNYDEQMKGGQHAAAVVLPCTLF
jgi:hypothetical protein